MALMVTFFTSSTLNSSFVSIIPTSKVQVEARFRTFIAKSISSSTSDSQGINRPFFNEYGRICHITDEKKSKVTKSSKDLEALWDDGYGTRSVQDYLDMSREMVKETDGGPPRWFCPVECGNPIKDSPVLLFLPGIDGTGWGLILHHESLGKVFDVRCLHIPVNDRTALEGLLEIIENAVRIEHASFPNRPVYLVGDSLGGCLALAVAACNPTIDLVLILSNPSTSFAGLHITFPYLFSIIMGNPIKILTANVENELLPTQTLEQMLGNLNALLPQISGLEDIMPKETLLWKLKLLKSAADFANSRLHAVRAEVLVLASGKDNLLPSEDEARRLWVSLKNCKVRHFKDNGHTLLLDDGLNMLSFIKATHMYRHSKTYDYVSDFIPLSNSELKNVYLPWLSVLNTATSPVLLSTLKDGNIVRGLGGIPNKGPVLLVGYHMLMGLELTQFSTEFWREKKTPLRGLAHPMLFSPNNETSLNEFSFYDFIAILGAVPVSPRNFYRLLSNNSFILLYPGGARLKYRGEEYKCFWPDQPEFVRMAAKFGATIIPFGVVGEDDITQYVLDYDDQMKIPFLRDIINEANRDIRNIRVDAKGEVAKQDMFVPGVLAKIPGRFYYLFGKPIETKGMEEEMKDKDNANAMYLKIKSGVEYLLSYLLEKREKDPYRGIVERTIYKAMKGPSDHVPTFEL
ncbi:acyltransferase-like protein At1g54570, chloroplastic [Papaver somniferum]|uniref:acyltransferase-like protein At1g54570, chloroplastic n=1 Tax=Papaver somniferum TaxID=3469 RepID=UPI000E6F686C|nr:acyltransferase-like protein At1g54570, chloroplastic [Papaver somniferum]